MTLQLIGTDALADNAVSTDKSQPFGNIILNSSAAGTDVGDRILLDRTNANGQDAGDAINVEKEILDIEGINVASRKQLKLGAVILESGTTDTVDGDVLLLDSTASGVDEGEMILYNETFNPATFNIGGTLTAGHAIKVNSAASGFEFAAGGYELLETTTISSSTAAVEFDSMNTRGFKVYKLSVIQARPVSDDSKPMIRVAGADGTIDTGNIYNRAAKGITSTGSDIDNGQVAGSSSAFLVFGGSVNVGSEADESFSFEMYMMGADDSATFTTFHATGTSVGSDYCTCIVSGCNVFEAAISTKLQFSMNSGNIAAGLFKLYGVL